MRQNAIWGVFSPSFGLLFPGLFYERDTGRCSGTIVEIRLAKKLDKMEFFGLNSMMEEAPQDVSEEGGSEGVIQEELEAEGPPEEAEVGGVAEEAVDAMGDEGVVGLLGGMGRDPMVERAGRRHHRHRPHHLPTYRHP